MRSKQHGKRLRQEGAIKRLETTLAMHEANAELTVAIMEEKKLSTGAADKVESIRSKKIERVRTTIENTKENIK
jgi:hypothetical protein